MGEIAEQWLTEIVMNRWLLIYGNLVHLIHLETSLGNLPLGEFNYSPTAKSSLASVFSSFTYVRIWGVYYTLVATSFAISVIWSVCWFVSDVVLMLDLWPWLRILFVHYHGVPVDDISWSSLLSWFSPGTSKFKIVLELCGCGANETAYPLPSFAWVGFYYLWLLPLLCCQFGLGCVVVSDPFWWVFDVYILLPLHSGIMLPVLLLLPTTLPLLWVLHLS